MIQKMTNVFNRTRLVFIKSFRSKTCLCKREVFTVNFFYNKATKGQCHIVAVYDAYAPIVLISIKAVGIMLVSL